MKNSNDIEENQIKSGENGKLQISNNAPLCIAGMHRSGTSMITRMLNISGLYLGQANQILPAAHDNPKGFWENIEFVRINEDILSIFGGHWNKIPKLPGNWFTSELMRPITERAKLLIQKTSIFYPWGWKDPRNSITYPFWNWLLPDLKVVIPLRDPYEVALSMNRRNEFPIEFGLSLWYEYNNALIAATSASQRIITHYDAYFDNTKAELKRLLAWLNWSTDEDKIKIASSTLTSNLRHHIVSSNPKRDYKELKYVFELYELLLKDAGPNCQSMSGGSHGTTRNISYKASSSLELRKQNSQNIFQPENKSVKKSCLISIIIPVFNKIDLTIKCITQIYKHTPNKTDFELIIVDDGSTDRTSEYLSQNQQSHTNLFVIRNPYSRGFAASCNMGASIATGENLLFIDNGTEMQSRWLRSLTKILHETKKANAIGAELLFENKSNKNGRSTIIDSEESFDPIILNHIFHSTSAEFPEANLLKFNQALPASALIIKKVAYFQLDIFGRNNWNRYNHEDLRFSTTEEDQLFAYQTKSKNINSRPKIGRDKLANISQDIKIQQNKRLEKITPVWGRTEDIHGKELLQSKIGEHKLDNHRKVNEHEPIEASIIILTYNQLSFTKECLQSIEKYTKLIMHRLTEHRNTSNQLEIPMQITKLY
ncbi:MAG: glycosyltransferase [Calditrichia bacterium]